MSVVAHTTLIFILIAGLILVVGYLTTTQTPASSSNAPAVAAPKTGADTTTSQPATTASDTTAAETDVNTDVDANAATSILPGDTTSTPAHSAAGTYAPYSETALARTDTSHTLLFFHASWCPSCKALDADITSNLTNIPSDVAIYKLDYDTALALRQQYGVTTQHTLVEVQSDGTLVQKWSGGNTLASVLNRL